MDGLSVGDATTVVNGPASTSGSHKHRYSDTDHGKQPLRPEIPTAPRSPGKLMHTTDYLLTDRPFFVPIGKDGLIAALQKLDLELRNVRASCAAVDQYSILMIVVFYAQAGYPSILSKKVRCLNTFRLLSLIRATYRDLQIGLAKKSALARSALLTTVVCPNSSLALDVIQASLFVTGGREVGMARKAVSCCNKSLLGLYI